MTLVEGKWQSVPEKTSILWSYYCETSPFNNIAVLYLCYNPREDVFVFEKREKQGEAIFDHEVIPGGKPNNFGELMFPAWCAINECAEELGIVSETFCSLGGVVEPQGYTLIYDSFLLLGIAQHKYKAEMPKHSHVKRRWEEVFNPNGTVNDRYRLLSTRTLLKRAYNTINLFNCR